MTPEEKIDQQIWSVLQDIEEQRRADTSRKDVKCRLSEFSSAKTISIHRIEDLLHTLEKQGVFEIRKGSNGGRLTNKSEDAFYLILNPAKYQEIREKYLHKIIVAQKLSALRKIKTPAKKASADDTLLEISDEAKDKLWKTVNALRLAYELEGDVTFKLPWGKFERNRASEEDTIANLRNLHRKGYVIVAKEILSRDPTKLPHWAKPQIKGAETILDNSDIYHDRTTTVTLKKTFFELKDALERHVRTNSTSFDWATVSHENLELAQVIIGVTLNYFELQPNNRLVPTKIPWENFATRHITFDQVKRVLNRVEGVKVMNEVLEGSIQGLDRALKTNSYSSDAQQKLVSTLPSMEDLRNNVFLQVASLEPLHNTKKVIDERLKSNISTSLTPDKSNGIRATSLAFDENSGRITYGERDCQIPKNTNQFFLCQKLFSEPCGKRVKEIEVLDITDWANDGKRSVYDAHRSVNTKAKRDLGIDNLFRWRNNHVWINEIHCLPEK